MWGVSSTSVARHGVGRGVYGLVLSEISLRTYDDAYTLPVSYEQLHQRLKDDFQKMKASDDVVSIDVTFSDKTVPFQLGHEFFEWATKDTDGAMALLMEKRNALGNQSKNRSFMLGIALDEYIEFMNKALRDRKIDAKKAAIYAGRIWFYTGLRWGMGNDEAKNLMTLIKGLLLNFTGYDLKDEDATKIITKLFQGADPAANKKKFLTNLDNYARYQKFRKEERNYVNGLFDDKQITINRPEGTAPPILAVK